MTFNTLHRSIFTLTAVTTLGLLGTAQAKQGEAFVLDLTKYTADIEVENTLFISQVDGGDELDLLLYLAQYTVQGKNGELELAGDLAPVAYIDGTQKGISAIYTLDGTLYDADELTVLVSDHNATLALGDDVAFQNMTVIPLDAEGKDVAGDTIHFDAPDHLELILDVTNLLDDGRMVLDLNWGEVMQECHIPSDHQHVRYGLQSSRDLYAMGLYHEDDAMIVCSDGVRVCSFDGDYMRDEALDAVIVGNAMDNTIMLSAFGYPGGRQYCDNVKNDPFTPAERYAVDGWPDDWKAGLRLYGEAGHDWIVDGPNDDYLEGAEGNDMLVGTTGSNFIYGDEGRDVMHGGNAGGYCSGGSPSDDNDCTVEGAWPYEGDFAGDCCCHSCVNYSGCINADATPGVSATDIPPTPW